MMLGVAALSAFWLGLLTAISPCPLATNIAAVSFIGRQAHAPGRALASSVAYTVGRALAYLLLAALLVSSLLSWPATSQFLQKHMNQALGPVLIVVSMFLLGLLSMPSFGVATGGAWMQGLTRFREGGAVALGFLFALSFCPVSAALFFGSLLPLAVQQESRLIVPACYGLGTGIPVLAFGVLIAAGAGSLGRWYGRVQRLEGGLRMATGIVLLAVGVYLTLHHVYGVA